MRVWVAPIVAALVFSSPFLASTNAKADECPITRGDAAPGGTSYQQITVQSGQSCSVPIYSTAGPILGLRVTKQAAHGVASTPALDEYDYRSHPKYVGPDAFTVVLASPRGAVVFDVSVSVER